MSGCASTLSCTVTLSVKNFPAYLAERCVLNGKVTVMLITMCSLLKSTRAVERRHSGKGVSERHHPSRAELEAMPTWVVRMVAGVVPGEWPGTERGFGLC